MLKATVKSQKSAKPLEQKLKKYLKWEVSGMSRNAVKRGRMENYSQIEIDLKRIISGCESHFFGSRVMGLSKKKSDLDIFIDMSKN